MSFLGWRGFTPVSEGLSIAYSVTVAEDLHPHLKDPIFCETHEVGKSIQKKKPGKMCIRNGVWDHSLE